MELKAVLGPVARGFNAGVMALTKAPWIGPRVSRAITEITYVGRRSGHTISTPVGFRRSGDEITIAVGMPDQKSWWRNFLGAGGPISLKLDGAERSGHAVARRDDKGRVSVIVHLNEVG
ncbi:nitroreductase/quinone reductase family protein [Nocardia sp. NPDC049526]|uniref:nitroreductase/quinone reductase family protein n=1 Tax=Nocardia sp. NPDC049526 TaxID=3364316 RepID=UPI00378DD16C